MAIFRISGVWIENNIITHYALHQVMTNGTSRATKTTKVEAIRIVEISGNVVTTWIWNYKLANWEIGEPVHVVNGANGKFLRSNHDNQVRDNLSHLINFDWISK